MQTSAIAFGSGNLAWHLARKTLASNTHVWVILRLQALAVMEGRQCLCQRWPAAAVGAVRHLPSANAGCNDSKRFAVTLQCSHSVCCSTGVSAFTNALLAPPKKQKQRKDVCLQSASMSQEGNVPTTSTILQHYVQAERSPQVGTCCFSGSSAKTSPIMFPKWDRIQSEGNDSFLASRTFVVGCLLACLHGWTGAGLMVCLLSCVAWCLVKARGLLLLDEAGWLISPR